MEEQVSSEAKEPGRVLVVEDNTLMLNTLRGLLEAQQYEVFTSENGEEALKVLALGGVDLIICDVMMPKMDGYTLYKHLREQPDYAHIPFVFLTALDDCHDIEKGKSIGADDYVTKPFEPRTLLAVVEGKMARSKYLRSTTSGRLDEFRARIVQTLSHEFRTPLVAISTGTELLLDHLATIQTGHAQTVLSAIKRGGERLERLVNDFMLIQQIEGGVAAKLFASRGRVVSLAEIHTGVLAAIDQLGETEQSRLECAPAQADIKIRAFLPHVVEAISRLISNGLKFGQQRPVTIGVVCEDNHVRITVRDYGSGFDLVRLGEALTLFGQLDREQYEQQGGGFGLTIAEKLITVNGGVLSFSHLNDLQDTPSEHAFEAHVVFPIVT